jgi:hypothetical protein
VPSRPSTFWLWSVSICNNEPSYCRASGFIKLRYLPWMSTTRPIVEVDIQLRYASTGYACHLPVVQYKLLIIYVYLSRLVARSLWLPGTKVGQGVGTTGCCITVRSQQRYIRVLDRPFKSPRWVSCSAKVKSHLQENGGLYPIQW